MSNSLVLSFDIGIHNLAFCCLEQTAAGFTVKAWDNVSLLTDSSNVTDAKETCSECKAKPKFTGAGRKVCGRHIPGLLQPLKDGSGNVLTKLPSVAVLKSALQTKISQNERIPAKKDALLELAAK